MQCPACHNEVEPAAFCSLCGAPLSAVAPPPAAAPGAPAVAASSGVSTNLAAALAYLTFIPAVLFLLIEPYNKIPLVRFHCFQSIGLFVVCLGVDVVVRMFPFGLIWMSSLISLALFVVWLIVVIKASQGQWFKLPIIGDFALKQAQG